MKKPAPTKAPIITIRPAKFTDASNVFRLIVADAEQREVELQEEPVMAHVVELIGSSRVFVADLSGRIVGAIGVRFADLNEISLLAVQHGFENAGIREALFNHIRKTGKDVTVVLTLNVSDPSYDSVLAAAQEAGFLLASETYLLQPAHPSAVIVEPETPAPAAPAAVAEDDGADFEARLRGA